MNSEQLSLEAAAIQHGLRFGYLKPEEVVSWADSWLQRLEEPPPALGEVSLGRPLSLPDLAHRLDPLLPTHALSSTFRTVFATMLAAVTRWPDRGRTVASALKDLATEPEFPADTSWESARWLVWEFDEYDRSVYESEAETLRALQELLAAHTNASLSAI